MSDKSKRTHIERLVYVAPDTCPGDSIRWNDWKDRPTDTHWITKRVHGDLGNIHEGYYAPGIPFTIIELASGSDYSGTLVERSNARALQKEFPWLVEISGGYATFGLGYLGKRENQNPALIEALDSLADYPLYDENDHSELEQETVDEAWDSDGRDDFKRALVAYFDRTYAPDEHDLDEIPDERIDQLWYDCTERFCGGESHVNEQGDSIYFPIDRVIRDIENERQGFDKPHYSGDRPSIADQLVSIATDATLAE